MPGATATSEAAAGARPAPLAGTPLGAQAVDARMLMLMRCVLALSALAIIWIDPLEPARWIGLTYASLSAYCLYSLGIALRAQRAGWPAPARALHWIDVAFYAWLVALTEGTSSIFFLFFFFAILVASFSRGYREGMGVAIVSFALFLTVGLVASPRGAEFELDRTLLRAVYLLAFGYIVAYMGGYERLLKRRLRLLQEITHLWNPRLGVEHAIGSNLERLRDFYRGGACLIVLMRPGPPAICVLQRASRERPDEAMVANLLAEEAAHALLRLPASVAGYCHDPEGSWQSRMRGAAAWDLDAAARGGRTRAQTREREVSGTA